MPYCHDIFLTISLFHKLFNNLKTKRYENNIQKNQYVTYGNSNFDIRIVL